IERHGAIPPVQVPVVTPREAVAAERFHARELLRRARNRRTPDQRQDERYRCLAHEIFPRAGPAGVISPAVFGKLSRRLPSEFAVQMVFPMTTGLVGVSSGPTLRRPVVRSRELRNTSMTRPAGVTTTMALRSLTLAHTLPASSKTMPSTPSSSGWGRKMFSRHSVLGTEA